MEDLEVMADNATDSFDDVEGFANLEEDTVTETETEVTEEPTEKEEEVTEPTEPTITETQRVSQRINEARQQAKDEFIASQGYEWNGRPITTEAQYQQAQYEQAEQQRNAKLEEQGIDPQMVNEAIENNPTVKQAKELLARQAEQEKINKNYSDFASEYPDVKPESISKETWEKVSQGASLVDAYARQEAKELKAKLKVYEQNEKTSKKAPIGSVTSHGTTENLDKDFLGFDD